MNGEEIYVSVIVPVYNVERYLKKCVESILAQSYSHYELLLIDDGSTDSSGELCDQCGKEDPRIRVFHKPNGGLSDARNYGIECARGDYLTFIDSDDYIGEKYLETLVGMIVEYDADASCVFSQMVFENKTGAVQKSKYVRSCVSGERALEYVLLGNLRIIAPAKLFKKELFETIRYPKGKIYEDMLTIPYVIARCSRVAYSDQTEYFWVQRKGSITHSPPSSQDLEWLDGLQGIVEWIDKNYPKMHEAAVCRYVNASVGELIQRSVYCKDYLEQVKKIKQRCGVYWREGLRNPYLGTGKKIQVALLLTNPLLYNYVYRLWAGVIKRERVCD